MLWLWVGLYIELNRDGGGSDMHLLHVTQTTLDPVTLAIVAFGFFGSGGCGGSTISGFERKNTVQLFPQAIFPGMAPLLSIHDGPSVL
jgi:hypothetical protein